MGRARQQYESMGRSMDLMSAIPFFETDGQIALGFALRFSMLCLRGVDALSSIARSCEHDM